MSSNVEERVFEYLGKHPGALEDDIAKDLELHIIDVLNAIHGLEKRGKIKEVA